jgi:hypothetical protein
MAMKDALAELRAFKVTITPTTTTGAAHPGKRARVQQDRLPEIARFRGVARSFRYFQFRGEGETVRELSVTRAKQESKERERVREPNEPSKSNEPSTSTSARATTQARVTSHAHQQVQEQRVKQE